MDTAPTVYFIDDSATMREVIKIAFRRENINVIACHDAASAFAQIELQAPDVVQKLAEIGIDAAKPNTPDEFAKFMRDDVARWKKVVKDANIETD